MACEIRMDADLGWVLARFEGVVDTAQLDDVRREIEAHPDFRPGLDRVWDERDARLQMTGDELRDLATHWSTTAALHGRRRVAYLVSTGLRWGLNRQFEAQREDPDVAYEMFTSWEACKAWLDLPSDLPDPVELLRRTY